MTKKSASKKTPARKRKTAASSKRPLNKITTTITVIVIIIFGAYYLLTGSDPLELFKQIEKTETPPTAIIDNGEDWWQVYFTDPQNINDPHNLAGSIPEKLIEYINNAQDSIHIAAFEFNLTPVAEALIAAHKRGVTVQWITDDEYGIEADEEEGHGQFAMLKKAGIAVKDDERGALMHNKFWIFDNQIVWTGSTNITVNGNFRNNNNVIALDSPQVAAIYEREFAEMWEGKFGRTSPSTVDSQATNIAGTPVQILFAAEDEVASHLSPLIENAQSSIRFMAFSFTHDQIGAAVLERSKAGVDVRGIFERRGSGTEYSEMPTLFCAGVPVHYDGNPRTFHHKVFIIDDQMVITGSFNFSNNADKSNDENVIIVSNSDIAERYLQEFERRWAESIEPNAADINCNQ